MSSPAPRAFAPPLPIDAALPALRAALDAGPRVVLQAPPGAGKTTRVPLALLDAGWLGGRTIVMLEPRRLAARAAARRMATTLGEPVGATVGFRVRAETRVGPRTRVEVVTEGVLTRMLQEDAALERAGAVLFDEFHERSLQADLGLALVLELQQVLRDDLRVLVMSATLDGARVAALLGRAGGGAPAPVVTSEGRAYPVEVRWRAQRPPAARGAAEAAAAATVRRALDAHAGDVLVFLPGAAEIRRAEEALAGAPLPPDVRVRPLHGLLAPAEQDVAIAPSAPGERKVVLATSIAETSLTIEGVRVVVDAGLARVPRFAPRTGMTHLDTVRVSRAAAEQRRGRAGRVAPGVCYRLWPEAEHAGLLPYALPEILEADLAPLALELAAAGVRDPSSLLWLDPPPAPAYARARELLVQLDALTAAGDDGRITAHGRRMNALGLHPRLAHMVLVAPDVVPHAAPPGPVGAAGAAASWAACALAALLAERDVIRGHPEQPAEVDVELRLALVHPGAVPATVRGAAVDRAGVHRVRADLAALLRRAGVRADAARAATSGGETLGRLLAAAYPDRVAQARPGAPGRFLLRNGRGVVVAVGDPLARAPYLAVAELVGTATERESRVALAAPLTLEQIEAQFATQIVHEDDVAWDAAADVVRARRVDRLGALVLRERPARDLDVARVASVLADVVRARVGPGGAGVDALGTGDAAAALRSRVAFLRRLAEVVGEPGAVRAGPWPDWRDAPLAHDLDVWLAPHLAGLRSWAEVRALDLGAILGGSLTHAQRAALDALAPTHLVVPSGSRVPIDYTDPEAPTLAVRLQELFGLAETPRVGGGRVPVVLELLSPAHRPVQVTRDLAGFWRSSYFDVRRELRGRYPKHSWPEDPLHAAATRKAKPRSAGQ
ncbi:ATP-dependent helicase [Gemmatimonadetes bacterium T265]|nr:ATP-dependent helicase [Gemmatimonadetes bacterium T265]